MYHPLLSLKIAHRLFLHAAILFALPVSCAFEGTGPQLDEVPTPPVISPAPGKYHRPIELRLMAEPGTRILYSLNGEEPRTEYRDPLRPAWGHRTAISFCSVKSLPDGQELRSEKVYAEYQVDLSPRLGTSHVKSLYRPPDPDRPPGETMLAEGARRASDLGMKAIKVYLFKPRDFHPHDSWAASYESPTALASTDTFSAFFSDPAISTYALTVYSTVDPDDHYFTKRSGFSDQAWASRMEEETRQFRELAEFFLTDERFAGKTFILQHWEGDWALRGSYDEREKVSRAAVLGMRDWLVARQTGVSQARSAHPASSARVFCAVEVNLVALAREFAAGAPENAFVDPTVSEPSYIPTVTNDVVPFVEMDLVSYSAYDTTTPYLPWGSTWHFRDALLYLKEKSWKGGPFGKDNVYIGEFGWAENFTDEGKAVLDARLIDTGIRLAIDTSLAAGVPWLFYWQLYDNESQSDGNIAGFHLYREDGSRSWAGEAFWNFTYRD